MLYSMRAKAAAMAAARYRELGFVLIVRGLKIRLQESGEVRLNKRKCLSLFAGLLTAAPIWAAHTNSVNWNVSSPMMIGSTEVKPGDYVLRVDDGGTQVEV